MNRLNVWNCYLAFLHTWFLLSLQLLYHNYNIDTTVVNQLEEGSRTEHLQAQRCRARLDHLESADADNLSEWSDMRLKRILVDYMLRMSYYDTALKLAESSNILVTFFSLPHLCTSVILGRSILQILWGAVHVKGKSAFNSKSCAPIHIPFKMFKKEVKRVVQCI